MAKKRPKQAYANPPAIEIPDVSFSLDSFDELTRSQGIKLRHFMSMVSPLGKKQKGDWRRPDQYDDESVGGLIFKETGCFTANMESNNRSASDGEGGIMNNSSCFIGLPRFYEDANGNDIDKRIYLAPGDKLYVANPEVDVKVVNYQEVEYVPDRDNILQFPAVCVLMIVDSQGTSFEEGIDFKITPDGNLRWAPNKKNPGIDPDTKKGRVYAVRYLYVAHWYVVSIPNEVRIGNVTEGNERTEQRFPYNAQLVREYVYHQRKNSNALEQPKEFDHGPSREVPNPPEPQGKLPFIRINMDDVEDE